jgi:hypothetical protein
MHIRNRVFFAAFLSLLLVGLFPPQASPQQAANKDTIVGTWTLVLVDNVLPDGTRVHLYGDNPQGILTFDAEGRYALQIYRAGRAKFASGDKSKGSPEENSAAVLGSNAHFGRYVANTDEGTIIFLIEHASFPNWEGTGQKRAFTISGDELTYTVPTPTSGGTAIGEVKWKRQKAKL